MSRLTLLLMSFCAILAIAFASPLPSNATAEQSKGGYAGIVSVVLPDIIGHRLTVQPSGYIL